MTAIVHTRMPCNSKATVVMALSVCRRVVVQEPVRAACPMKGSEILIAMNRNHSAFSIDHCVHKPEVWEGTRDSSLRTLRWRESLGSRYRKGYSDWQRSDYEGCVRPTTLVRAGTTFI